MIDKANLLRLADNIDSYWDPHIIGELNGQMVKLVKIKGDFVWHSHEAEDELFLVVKGRFHMELRDHTIELKEGEYIIIPKGMEHRPKAKEEAIILLFEPATTLNTGNVESPLTRHQLKTLR